ncbi:hypothetical protein XENTR_v10005315 [Xenopus tropicalis]|nr:hypothetical protein XENTR_v10005315 [Xenopus tropicalis]
MLFTAEGRNIQGIGRKIKQGKQIKCVILTVKHPVQRAVHVKPLCTTDRASFTKLGTTAAGLSGAHLLTHEPAECV